jgi:FMN reductase
MTASASFGRDRPLVVGIGGTVTAGSSTEQALAVALRSAAAAGADTRLIGGDMLCALPHYGSRLLETTAEGLQLVDAIRQADGLIIATPGYHGSISGLVKNALDYAEETARDRRVYLDGVPVGLIATAYGWQATGGALTALRSIVHALRGWPTPLGAAINTSGGIFRDGVCSDERACAQLETIGRQVHAFAALGRGVSGRDTGANAACASTAAALQT